MLNEIEMNQNIVKAKEELEAQEDRLRKAKNDYRWALHDRQWELNEKFVWNDATRERFLYIQSLLVNALTAAWDEAVAISEDLDRRIDSGDTSLMDYEIDVKLYPNMEDIEANSAGYSFRYFLTGSLASERLSGSTCYVPAEKRSKSECIVLECDNLEPDWKGRLQGVFDDSVQIAHVMHTLIEDARWAFEDILSIKTVWANIEVHHQVFIDVEPMDVTGASSEGDAR